MDILEAENFFYNSYAKNFLRDKKITTSTHDGSRFDFIFVPSGTSPCIYYYEKLQLQIGEYKFLMICRSNGEEALGGTMWSVSEINNKLSELKQGEETNAASASTSEEKHPTRQIDFQEDEEK